MAAANVESPSLSCEDITLLRLLAHGLALDAVARRLATSQPAVRRRTRAVCDRLGVGTPIEAFWAARKGLL